MKIPTVAFDVYWIEVVIRFCTASVLDSTSVHSWCIILRTCCFSYKHRQWLDHISHRCQQCKSLLDSTSLYSWCNILRTCCFSYKQCKWLDYISHWCQQCKIQRKWLDYISHRCQQCKILLSATFFYVVGIEVIGL